MRNREQNGAWIFALVWLFVCGRLRCGPERPEERLINLSSVFFFCCFGSQHTQPRWFWPLLPAETPRPEVSVGKADA